MSPATLHLAAALSDRYRIERELGAGGMATVYLAHDVRHDRKVAIKVLKPELAAVLGAERFVQEIKTTAALSHPHILPLFDSGEAAGFLFYVMPYIQGETIREKLNRETQFGIDDAVRIAREVADALDYAHRHGVIHRDIKPENILLHDGRAMVMDFGIALAVSAAAGGRMTETGLSLGTPHYMSPEQATADRAITARSDVYSLASVLYEMLTGEPPHTGSSAQQIIMKIVTDVPRPATELRKSVPPNVSAALDKALEKLPADRYASAKAFADGLANPQFSSGHARTRAGSGRGRAWNRRTLVLGGLAVITTGVAIWAVLARPAVASRPVFRTTIELPDTVMLGSENRGSRVAISPDGRRMVFAALNGPTARRLWVRPADREEVEPLPGTDDAAGPFFSPDGERVGFVTISPGAVKTVAFDGRMPHVVLDSGVSTGFLGGRAAGVWGDDGFIYLGTSKGVMRLPAEGGPPTVISRLDSATHERAHWPDAMLPGGKAMLITVAHLPTTMSSLFDIAVLDLRTGTHHVLTRGVRAHYVPEGYLVFARSDGSLMAAAYSPDRPERLGDPIALSAAGEGGEQFREFELTNAGSMLHPSVASDVASAELVWVSRSGSQTPVFPDWHANIESVSLSPDGKQVAVGVMPRAGAEVWIGRLPGGPMSTLALSGTINYRPTWAPNGEYVVFRRMNEANGRFEIFAKRADGVGPIEPVVSDPRSISTGFITSDGAWRIYRTDATEGGRGDILGKRTGDSVATPLVATAAEERFPAVSPDGRWLAYRSDAGGSPNVWVSSFPNTSVGRWQVSLSGGTEPVWSRSGRELFYLTPANELVAARVSTSGPFEVVERKTLFTRPPTMPMAIAIATYDVDVDDSRFLMVRSTNSKRRSGAGGEFERVVFVENWIEELRARIRR